MRLISEEGPVRTYDRGDGTTIQNKVAVYGQTASTATENLTDRPEVEESMRSFVLEQALGWVAARKLETYGEPTVTRIDSDMELFETDPETGQAILDGDGQPIATGETVAITQFLAEVGYWPKLGGA